MAREYTLPVDLPPALLEQNLIIIANNMARMSDLVAEYKTNAAIATTAYKRAYARALVKFSGEKNATLTKALADVDADVVVKQDALDQANAVYAVAMGEYEGYEAQFVALRKIVEIRKMEVRTI